VARIVIIGAGLTGISAAYHLEQHGFFDYLLFEKEATPGGLCRSVTDSGFTFDYTGHLLHASDNYFYALMQKCISLDAMNVINRRSFIYSHGVFTKYPFQINLHGLPTSVIVECITEFVNRNSNKTPHSFADWVRTHFGNGIGKYFFFPFQEKIFSYDINKITASWTGRFVPSTSLEQMLYGTLSPHNQDNVGYNARFLYPKKGGIFGWIKAFAEQLKKPIITNHCATTIDMRTKKVIFSNGHSEPYELLISTMPLDGLLYHLHEKPTVSVKKALMHLKCNKVVNFNLGINRPDISDKHWIYFPEKKYPFYRLGFWHNFSEHMAPAGHSSLYGEFSYLNKSSAWVHETLQKSLRATKKLFKLSSRDIVTEKIIAISHAYVIYDHWRERHLPTLLNRLQQEHIYSVGRYGAWKYASMQEAVLDGKEVAHHILKNSIETNVISSFPSTRNQQISL
jgi:protoporphyrinogen oxidase